MRTAQRVTRLEHATFVPTLTVKHLLVELSGLMQTWAEEESCGPGLVHLVEAARAGIRAHGPLLTLDEVRGVLFPLIDALRESITDHGKLLAVEHILTRHFAA